MATIIASVVGGNSNTNGAWVGGVQPTAADDVIIDGTSAGITIPSTTTLACRSLNGSGGKLTFAATTSILNVGDASGGAVIFSNTSTVTLTAIGTINFLATTASTTYSLTTGGRVMPNLTINTGTTTTIQFADAVTATNATVTLTQGKLDTNSMSVNCAGVSSANSNTRTLTLGTSSVTCTGGSINAWSFGTVVGLTLSAASSTITLTGSASTFSNNYTASSYGTVVLSGSQQSIGNSSATTIVNLTFTGSVSKADFRTISGILVVTGALTVGGNTTQGVNRLLIQSSSVGTLRTFTATGAAVVITGDVDFQDIAIVGNSSWTNTGAAYVGDALGNNSTVTTNATVAANQTHTASAGGNWSDATKWTSRVPLPQDNVVVNVNTTGTITADMPRLGANVDFTGFAGTASFSSVPTTIYGNLTWASGMTISGANLITLFGRGSQTLTSAGRSFSQSVTLNTPGGTYTQQDAFMQAGTFSVTVTNGTWTTQGFSVTAGAFSSTTNTTTNMGASTFSLYRTDAINIWNCGGTATINAGTSAIVITAASASTRTFQGNGKTYGTLTYNVANSPGLLTITGSNTFAAINFSDATNARTLTLPASTATTVTTLNANGTGALPMTINSSTPGTKATLQMNGPCFIANDTLTDITLNLGGNVEASTTSGAEVSLGLRDVSTTTVTDAASYSQTRTDATTITDAPTLSLPGAELESLAVAEVVGPVAAELSSSAEGNTLALSGVGDTSAALESALLGLTQIETSSTLDNLSLLIDLVLEMTVVVEHSIEFMVFARDLKILYGLLSHRFSLETGALTSGWELGLLMHLGWQFGQLGRKLKVDAGTLSHQWKMG